MTEPTHTPVPWAMDSQHTPARVTGPSGDTVAAVYGGFVGSEAQLANARLITAAPALLQYVEKSAAEGDEEAKAIVAGLEAPDAEPG